MKNLGNFIIDCIPGRNEIAVRIEPGSDGDVWMSKEDIARTFGVLVPSVRTNLKKLMQSKQLDEHRNTKTIRFTFHGRQCSRDVYNLEAIIALGFQMKGCVCNRFREWVVKRLSESFRRRKTAFFIRMENNPVRN